MTFSLRLLAVMAAAREVGVREERRNRGPRVEQYLAAAGSRAGEPWCAAFVVWCFREAAKAAHVPSPCPKTASALGLLAKAQPWQRVSSPRNAAPGCVFFIDHGAGRGHCGIIEGIDFVRDELSTIEGNTNVQGGREGDGVYRRKRGFVEVCGYADFGADPPVA